MKQKRSKSKFTLKEICAIVFCIGLLLYFVGLFAYRQVENYYINHYRATTVATTIDKKNFYGNGGVSPRRFSYSYIFSLNGKDYTGDSQNSDLGLHAGISVEYCYLYPKFNRPIEHAEFNS